MKKLQIALLGLLLLTTISCEEDSDAIYVTHKLVLGAQRISDYYVEFTWNDISSNDHDGFLLIKTYEEKDISFYSEVLDYYVNDYYTYPDWIYETDIYHCSSTSTSREMYDRYDSGLQYYKLIAYNYNNNQIIAISNTVKY
ncbi:hypothetical protein ACFLS4_00660 [Bacteroidota bacterium]